MNKFKSILMAGVLFAGMGNCAIVCNGPTWEGQVAAGACIGLTTGSIASRLWKEGDRAGLLKQGGALTALVIVGGMHHFKNFRSGIAEQSGIGKSGLDASFVFSVGKFGWDLGNYYYYEKTIEEAVKAAEEGELYRFRNGKFVKAQR